MTISSLVRQLAVLLVLAMVVRPLGADSPNEFTITVTSRYNTQNRQPQILREFFKQNPPVRLEQWDGIQMPAEGSRAS
ncbi:MAG: hypothetical protein RBU25_03465, partial [Lentisphaeria bacterium]|nr:hypothetical protein [Lentisphaeria bacterium]